jgi:hypothetical protein
LQYADSGKRTDSGAQSRATDTQLLCQISFRWQSIARAQLTLMNHFAKLRNYFLKRCSAPFRVDSFEDAGV